jgi:prolyl-tRNA editing enzyme YbaK/EbsC (Cys-tRNA(Pro) deacylase)
MDQLEKEFVYSGGSENALVRISTQELPRASRGRVVQIRK